MINKEKRFKLITWIEKHKFKTEDILSPVSGGWELREEITSNAMWEAGKGLL